MTKRLLSIVTAAVILLGISACSIKKDNNTGFVQNTAVAETTDKPTYYHNSFKDRIPELDFKEEAEEKYVDGDSYHFVVKCSEKEFEKYTKNLKKHGFENNLVEATGYFYAKDGEGYYAELVYKNGTLTATVDR
ncbi:MAG: hypothetical protein IJ395_00690 [Clostridia bacterium]|nr:hypothetical protein [Clostridia bacterium]